MPKKILDLNGRPINYSAVLKLRLEPNDAHAKTIRGYLEELLKRVWDQGESFSGKRPFGNSGWERELYDPLIEAGLMRDGENDVGHSIIYRAIQELFSVQAR